MVMMLVQGGLAASTAAQHSTHNPTSRGDEARARIRDNQREYWETFPEKKKEKAFWV
jgi:hypothetical protein